MSSCLVKVLNLKGKPCISISKSLNLLIISRFNDLLIILNIDQVGFGDGYCQDI